MAICDECGKTYYEEFETTYMSSITETFVGTCPECKQLNDAKEDALWEYSFGEFNEPDEPSDWDLDGMASPDTDTCNCHNCDKCDLQDNRDWLRAHENDDNDY